MQTAKATILQDQIFAHCFKKIISAQVLNVPKTLHKNGVSMKLCQSTFET